MKFSGLFAFCLVFLLAIASPAVAENILGPHVPQNAKDVKRVEDMISLAEDIEAFYRKTGHYPLVTEPQANMLVVGISDFAAKNPETPPVSVKVLQDALQKELGNNIELPRDPDEGREGVMLRIYQYATDGQSFYVSAFLQEETFYTRRVNDGLFMMEVTSRPSVRDSQYSARQIKRFLKHGADKAEVQEELQNALRKRDFKAAKAAIENGANPSPVCDYYTACQPLAAAAREGFMDVVEFLVENGADIDGFNTAYDVPLMYSLQQGRAATSEMLVKAGANVNIPNALGETPFIRAVGAGDAELAELMLKHGARVNTRYLALNALAKPGETGPRPLEAAIGSGREEMVKLILAAGADPLLEGREKKSMLQIAEEKGDKSIIGLLKAAAKK